MSADLALKIDFSPEQNLGRYFKEIRKFPILSAEEEYTLATRYIETKDQEAAYKLISSHLRLVVKIASGYKGYKLPIGEIISEGNIGLVQALNKFEPEKGFRLSTYAIWWIRAAIQKYILHSWSLVKIGTTTAQKKLFFNLKKIKNSLDLYHENSLSDGQINEIAEKLQVSKKEVINMDQRLLSQDQSLNKPISNSNDSNDWESWIADSRKDQETSTGDDELLKHRKQLLFTALKDLNKREKHILFERKLKEKATTLDNLSKHYKISRERVRQIEINAINKLKKKINNNIAENNLNL